MATIFIKNAETTVDLLVRVWDLNNSTGIPWRRPIKAGKYEQMNDVETNPNDGTSSIQWQSDAAGHDSGSGGPTAVVDGGTYPVTAGPLSKS